MDFEKIAQYDDGKGLELLPTIAALKQKKQRGLTMFQLDDLLVNTNAWESQTEMFPCRSGLFMCYEKWGNKFGKTLEWEGLTVLIPKKFQGKENIALVCYNDQLAVKGKTISSAKFEAFDLPHDDGWYDIDNKYGLPKGEKKDYADERRKLWRYQSEAYVGLVVRDDRWGGCDGRCVGCGDRPYDRFGVFGNNPKKQEKVKPNLKLLAQAAKKALDKMRGVIKEELLAPLDGLVGASQ